MKNTVDAHTIHAGADVLVSIKTGEITQAQAVLNSEQVKTLIQELQLTQKGKAIMTTQNPGLVDQVQTELLTFRASAKIQGEYDFRELAVSIVRVFRDYIEAEIRMLDPYDTKEPGKGQGWE